MNKKNMVSVIMPVYNAEKYVKDAIDSILSQTYTNFELLVIDDGSIDNSVQVIHELLSQNKDKRIRFYQNESNKGIAYTRNRCLELCTGEYIAILDDDDIAEPNRLELQVQYLNSHTEINIVGGRTILIDEHGKLLRECGRALNNPRYIKASLIFSNVFVNSEMMFRRSIIDIDQIRYKDNYYGVEDYRFWCECSLKNKIVMLDEVFLRHRVQEERESNRSRKYFPRERKEKLAEIQKYMLKENGFKLNEDETNQITKVLCEGLANCKDFNEVLRMREILKKIVKQAYDMGLEEKQEVEIVCKQRLAHIVKGCSNIFG